ncbi:unnamed protein product [Amoebophrya sp. A25]|nr:unnamed protein product [Amoebophrya sp. A25]|eukprot:GSA25T00014204001.1
MPSNSLSQVSSSAAAPGGSGSTEVLFFFTGVGVCNGELDDTSALEGSPTWQYWQEFLDAATTPTEKEILRLAAIQTSLFDLWSKEWGIFSSAPAKLAASHSLGDLAALYACGIHSLDEVRRLAVWIASAMEPFGGWMASCYEPKNVKDEKATGNKDTNGKCFVASENFVSLTSQKRHVTVCGRNDDGSWEAFQAANPSAKKLAVNHCWHHPSVRPVGKIPLGAPSSGASGTTTSTKNGADSKSFWSSCTGKWMSQQDYDAEKYWAQWLCNPVSMLGLGDAETRLKSSTGMANIAMSGNFRVVEIGAHPICAAFIPEFPPLKIVHSMNRNEASAVHYIVAQRAEKLPQRVAMQLRHFLTSTVLTSFPRFDPALPWLKQGMTSLVLTEISSKLQRFFPGLQPGDLYSYHTLDELWTRYGDNKAGSSNTQLLGLSGAAGAGGSSNSRIVITGMGCWLPGAISSPADAKVFFEQCRDAVRLEKGFHHRECGYMEDFPFHFSKFGVRAAEARNMDPQQQLSLFVADLAIQDSKLSADVLKGPRTGVYMGVWNQDFQGTRDSAYDVVGSNPSIIASRISSHWDCRGPSIVVNTACASSLECVVRAMDDMRLNKIDHAIVGGVNVIHNPEFTDRMKRGGFLGESMRCRTFDDSADGYVRSEGCVVLVLSRGEKLAPASYYCEVAGGASNHNGYSPLITVPSAAAQSELILAACANAGITTDDLDYLECHGTGTRIGDPIEVDGITRACLATLQMKKTQMKRTQPLYLGSAKANLGHLESGAGVTGLLRAVLSLQAQAVFGNPLLRKLNPGLKCPSWMVPAKDLTPARLGFAGVSSFGFGGSNAHIVLTAPGSKTGGRVDITKLMQQASSTDKHSPPEVLLVTKPKNMSVKSSVSDVSDVSSFVHLKRPDVEDCRPGSCDGSDGTPPATTANGAANYAASNNIGAVLRQLVRIISQMGVQIADRVSTPLLEVGMDSMSVTDLFLQIQQQFGTEILLEEVDYASLSAAMLAQVVVSKGGSAPVGAAEMEALEAGEQSGATTVVSQKPLPPDSPNAAASSPVIMSPTLPNMQPGKMRAIGSMASVASDATAVSTRQKLSHHVVTQKLFGMLKTMGVQSTEARAPLQDLGLDSLAITDLFLQMDRTFGTTANNGDLLIEGVSVDKLATFILSSGNVDQSVVNLIEMKASASSPQLKMMEVMEGEPASPVGKSSASSKAAPQPSTKMNNFMDKLGASAVCDPIAPVASAKPAAAPSTTAPTTAGKAKGVGFEDLESFDYYLTRPFQKKRRGILTTHVGSLPRSFGATSYDHIFQQIDIGLDIVNDGEVNRASYADEVLSRLTGFKSLGAGHEASLAHMPHDVAECPNCARRFMGKSSLITLNRRLPALNPACVGEVTYHNATHIRKYLDEYEHSLRRNGTEPSSAFYSCPSPGTLALFFKNTYYTTDEEYLEALARAVAHEYREVVRRGFTLQIDCPDLAMGRHTQFQKMSDREFIQVQKTLINALNLSIEGLPPSQVRVHICWGNYGFSHHRDIPLDKIVDNLNLIRCSELLIENANPRHNHEIDAIAQIHNAVITLGCVDTSSPHVENPNLVAQRLCKLAQMVGPDRVKAGTDCGFATTSESNSNTEIVVMKMRSLVRGARIASSILFNGISLFEPRARARIYWFGEPPQRNLPTFEIRYVPDSLLKEDVRAVVSHMKSYTELPAFFVEVRGKENGDKLAGRKGYELNAALTSFQELQTMLEYSAAYPQKVLKFPGSDAVSFDTIMATVRDGIVFDPYKLRMEKRFLENSKKQLKSEYEVVIVGAGITGLHVAHEMQQAGIDFCLLEKDENIAGIWKHYANERSQVNTSEAAYRLLDKVNTNKDHSTTREILTDAVTVATGLGDRLFLKAAVSFVDKTGESAATGGTQYRVRLEDGSIVRSKGCIMAINDRVGKPRLVKWPRQEVFQGEIRDGFSNDAADLDWVGKKVVIVGMGAFATENLRTAMEMGAASVTILARRHGTVCPKYIDYINFVNKNSGDNLGHDSVTNTKNMITWRSLYERTGAKMPECWMKEIKHYGHTISVSDIWFIGHHLRILDSLADEIDYFREDGIVCKDSGSFLPCDIVIKCTGFERNAQLIPILTPYNAVNSCNYLDTNFMYLADALIDDNVFNSVFGSSVVEMAKLFCSVYLYFWRSPEDYALIQEKLALVPVEIRKWSDYIGGLDLLYENFQGIRDISKQRIDKRREDFLKAHNVEEYLRENRREWNELHHILGVWSEQTAVLPYPKWSASSQAAAQ